jgi:hypothetical protein
MLKRDDLVEMKLPIGVRNKVLDYISKFKNTKDSLQKTNKRAIAEQSGLKVMELMLNSIVKISKNSATKSGGCACTGDNSVKKSIHKNGVRPYNM